jgi:hypothetical protein
LDRVHPGHISTALHRCACVGSIYSLGVYLQIAFFAIIALAASALAIAAHHQSMKCATPLSPSARLQSTLVSTKARLTSCAQLAGRFVGSADRRTHSEFSSLLPAGRSLGWSHGCFVLQQGVSAVTGGTCALDHRSDHNQTAAATGPERQRKVVGMLAAFSHVISPTTPRVVAGPPARPVIRRR